MKATFMKKQDEMEASTTVKSKSRELLVVFHDIARLDD